MGLILLFMALFFTLPSSAAAPTPAKESEVYVNEVVSKLQKVWDATQSYKAKFKQIIISKRIGTRDENDGTLSVVKPNRLRWESETNGNMQILNGKKLVNIQKNKRRKNRTVDIYSDVKKAMGSTALNFLSGKAKFKELYNVKLVSETPKQAELKLTSKKEGEETLIAEVDKASYLLRSLTTENTDSQVRIEFSDIKTNVPLDDKLFEFKAEPKDIIQEE